MVCEDFVTFFGYERIALREPQVCRNHLGNQIRKADLGSPAPLFRIQITEMQGVLQSLPNSCDERYHPRQFYTAPRRTTMPTDVVT
jgi:hypothetical protein